MRASIWFGGLISCCLAVAGCHLHPSLSGHPVAYNLPPAQRILEPGPGVGGPGPGVLAPEYGVSDQPQQAPTAQILFSKPEGMHVQWDVTGVGKFDSTPLIVPGRFNFPQGGIYRLKLTNIEGREGVELYPSLEIATTSPRTAAYLAHNAIPVQFTNEDFDQVLAGNFVTKVIYLPDPEFQELALARVETLVSTRLDPGVDPIVEADHRGAILAIIRMGNKDEEMPELNGQGGAVPASYTQDQPARMTPLPYSSGSVQPNYISGVTAPPWGMPLTGTPIGLPGPPHIPLGVPAGLQRHTVHNHTHMYIPRPERQLNLHVQQVPGLAYPPPANQIYVQERTVQPLHINRQPASDMRQGYVPHGAYPYHY